MSTNCRIRSGSLAWLSLFLFACALGLQADTLSQIYEVYNVLPGNQETLSSGITVTYDIGTAGTATPHPNQGEQYNSTDFTTIGASPTTSYASTTTVDGGAVTYENFIYAEVTFSEAVLLTGDFIVADVDWAQVVSVFAMDGSTLVEADSTTVGSSLTEYTDSVGWTNSIPGVSITDSLVDAVAAPNSGGTETNQNFWVTYTFTDAEVTALYFVFAEDGTGGAGSGGALVSLDFTGAGAGVTASSGAAGAGGNPSARATGTPEPTSASLLLVAFAALSLHRPARRCRQRH